GDRLVTGPGGGAGVVVVTDEVVAEGDALGREGVTLRDATATEVGVVVVDTGVDDADPDALAGDAELAVHDVRAGHALRRAHLRGEVAALGPDGRVDDPHREDGLDGVRGGQGGQRPLVGGDGQAVPEGGVLAGDLDL